MTGWWWPGWGWSHSSVAAPWRPTNWALFRAVADAGMAVEDVDLFVFASRFEHPAVGQRTLLPVGAGGATILNTENACASGTMGVEIAAAYLRAGMARIAAVVGIEKASDLGSSVPLPAWDRLAAAGITHPVRYALEAKAFEIPIPRCTVSGNAPSLCHYLVASEDVSAVAP